MVENRNHIKNREHITNQKNQEHIINHFQKENNLEYNKYNVNKHNYSHYT